MRYYWQFKNGSLAQIHTSADIDALPEYFFEAWDRSLSAWVGYV